jgi:hypothetical protein
MQLKYLKQISGLGWLSTYIHLFSFKSDTLLNILLQNYLYPELQNSGKIKLESQGKSNRWGCKKDHFSRENFPMVVILNKVSNYSYLVYANKTFKVM